MHLKRLKVDFMLCIVFQKKKKMCVIKESSSCWCDFELAPHGTPAWRYCTKERLSPAHTWQTSPRMALALTAAWDEGLAALQMPRLLPLPLRNPCGVQGWSFIAPLWVKSIEGLAWPGTTVLWGKWSISVWSSYVWLTQKRFLRKLPLENTLKFWTKRTK